MRLNIDLETLQLIEGPGFRNPVTSLRFKRGDAARLEVAFLQNGTTPVAIGDPELLEIRFGVKPRGRYDVGYLVYTAAWTMPDPEATSPVYLCSPSFNTEELDSALNVGSSTATELSEVILMGEITWREGAGEPTSTRTFVVVVENDVNRGTEGVPESAEPPYPAPENIALLTSVVRHDTAQSLTTPQKAQARTNIDAASGAQGAKADTALQAARLGHGVNSILVDASADNAISNGTALLAAYTAAKALTPNGAALSATNRATVLIPPGKYDLNGYMLTLDTQYVDLVGLSSDRSHALITSATSGQNSGTVVQMASDVRLANLTLQNTLGNSDSEGSATKPAAYMPTTNLSLTVCDNVKFIGTGSANAMRSAVEYSGTFTRCEANPHGFGYLATASGSFTDCVTARHGFGYGATASGMFKRCTAGWAGFGYGPTGTFHECSGNTLSWGGTIGGLLFNCVLYGGSFGTRGTSGRLMGCRYYDYATWQIADDTLELWYQNKILV